MTDKIADELFSEWMDLVAEWNEAHRALMELEAKCTEAHNLYYDARQGAPEPRSVVSQALEWQERKEAQNELEQERLRDRHGRNEVRE